jgi:hypothetical protein
MKITIIVLFVLIAINWTISNSVHASGNNNSDTTINFNDVTEVTEVTSITSGVSDKDLAEGLALALAAGGHQFDYGTHAFQGSIVGSYESDQEQSAVSFGLAKHFQDMDALLHTSYSQSSGEHYLTFGGTWRF